MRTRIDGGINRTVSCYNNGLYGPSRMVFFVDEYFIVPEYEKYGRYFLWVATDGYGSNAAAEFAGRYKTTRDVVRAMLMMLGNDELRYEYGAILALRGDPVLNDFNVSLSFAW